MIGGDRKSFFGPSPDAEQIVRPANQANVQQTVSHRRLTGISLTEQLKDRELELTDGIKVLEDRGWAQVLPDPDEPLVHIYAEGRTEEDSKALEEEYRQMVEEIMETEGASAPV